MYKWNATYLRLCKMGGVSASTPMVIQQSELQVECSIGQDNYQYYIWNNQNICISYMHQCLTPVGCFNGGYLPRSPTNHQFKQSICVFLVLFVSKFVCQIQVLIQEQGLSLVLHVEIRWHLHCMVNRTQLLIYPYLYISTQHPQLKLPSLNQWPRLGYTAPRSIFFLIILFRNSTNTVYNLPITVNNCACQRFSLPYWEEAVTWLN